MPHTGICYCCDIVLRRRMSQFVNQCVFCQAAIIMLRAKPKMEVEADRGAAAFADADQGGGDLFALDEADLMEDDVRLEDMGGEDYGDECAACHSQKGDLDHSDPSGRLQVDIGDDGLCRSCFFVKSVYWPEMPVKVPCCAGCM